MKWLAAIALLCVALALGLLILSRTKPAPPVAVISQRTEAPATVVLSNSQIAVVSIATNNSTSVPQPIQTKPTVAVIPETEPPPTALPEPDVPENELPQLPASIVLENLRTVFRQYQSKFDGNPVGTNLEITRTLNGGNAKQARYLKMEDGMRVNAKGELIDNWGTPYFFHQLSGTEMEIHSAGPDKKMWTSDDLVVK